MAIVNLGHTISQGYDRIQGMSHSIGSYFSQGQINSSPNNYLHEYYQWGRKNLGESEFFNNSYANLQAQQVMGDIFGYDNRIAGSHTLNGSFSDFGRNYTDVRDLFTQNGFGVNSASMANNFSEFEQRNGITQVLNSQQRYELANTGQLNLNGTTIQINAVQQNALSGLLKKAENLDANYNYNGLSTNERMTSFKQMQTFAENNLQNVRANMSQGAANCLAANGIDLNCNSHKTVRNIENLLKDPKQLTMLSVAERNELQSLATGIKAKNLTSQVNTANHRTGIQTYGMSSLGNKYLGGNMMSGINAYRGAINLSTRAGRQMFRGLDSLRLNAINATASLSLGISTKFGRTNGINRANGQKKAVADRKAYNKALYDARRNRDTRKVRELQQENRLKRRNERDIRRAKRINSRNMNNNPRMKARADYLMRRTGRRSDNAQRRKQTYRNIRRKWNKFLAKYRRFSIRYNLIKLKNRFFSFVGRLRKKIIMAVGGFFGGFIILSMGIPVIVMVVIHFLSEPTDLMGTLDNLNYNQYIVDNVNQNMSYTLLKAIKNDSKWYYTFNNIQQPSDGLEWYKTISNSEIGSIKDEYGNEVASLNNNLQAIYSMTRFRYLDLIDFNNHVTPMAYAYYLYANTHRVTGYSWDSSDNCNNDELYTKQRYYCKDDGVIYYGSPILHYDDCGLEYEKGSDAELYSGNLELCENIYIHGYHTIFNSSQNGGSIISNENLNKAMCNMSATGIYVLNKVTDVINIFLPDDHQMNFTVGEGSGLFIEQLPYDNVGTCDNYRVYRYDDNPWLTENGGHCPGIHTHHHGFDSCYDTVYDCGLNHLVHIGCSSHEVLTCNKIEHTEHNKWYSDTNPGCYKTAYLCKGHCGGHITATADVEVVSDIRNIAPYDIVCLPATWTGESDFWSIVPSYPTVTTWKAYWNFKAFQWFTPLPLSPLGTFETLTRYSTYFGAGLVDSITQTVAQLIQGNGWDGVVTALRQTGETLVDNTIADKIDAFGFEEWEDSTLEECETWYGTYFDEDDNHNWYPYYSANDLWKDLGEVTFPQGGARPFNTEQIDTIMETVEKNYTLSDSQKAILKEALTSVGNYFYSETDIAQENGATNTRGRSNGSGFVSGVINRALGQNINWNYSDFCSSSKQSTNTPAMIYVKNKNNFSGGKWGTKTFFAPKNDIVIFLGNLNLSDVEGYNFKSGLSKSGNWVIHIDSNGSRIEKMNIDNYQYEYKAW